VIRHLRHASGLATALVALVLSSCGGLQPIDAGVALKDGGAALAKIKTVNASLKFTQGKISVFGYDLVSADAAVRLPSESDTIYKVRSADVQISLEVIITNGKVYLHPPFSGYTEVVGADAKAVPDLARLFTSGSGLPAVIPEGQNPKYLGAENLNGVDCHKVQATYTADIIKVVLPQIDFTGSIDATIWVGGSDHLIRRAVLKGAFGDNNTDATVQVDLSGFDGSVKIATPAVTPAA